MNNPINLAIGVAVLCCSFSCATSFMNTGLGDIFGGAGGLVTGAGGLVTGAGNAAGDAALAAADAVTGGTNLTQVDPASLDKRTCQDICGDCKQETFDAHPEGRGEEWKALCYGEATKKKFGSPCCKAEITTGTVPTDSSYKGPRPEGAAPAGGFKGEIEGYTIRKRVR
jgi:hypothetical protein